MILIDLDNLKKVNDTKGHLVGDQVLLELAKVIKASRRHYDWAGRWGGDEFMLVLPGANLVEAKEVAERMRASYEKSQLISGIGQLAYASMGIACNSGRPGDQVDLDKLFEWADRALYRAKERGRSRVEVHRD